MNSDKLEIILWSLIYNDIVIWEVSLTIILWVRFLESFLSILNINPCSLKQESEVIRELIEEKL